jgi:hypothetical protein
MAGVISLFILAVKVIELAVKLEPAKVSFLSKSSQTQPPFSLLTQAHLDALKYQRSSSHLKLI